MIAAAADVLHGKEADGTLPFYCILINLPQEGRLEAAVQSDTSVSPSVMFHAIDL